jgi:hypothetical protein
MSRHRLMLVAAIAGSAVLAACDPFAPLKVLSDEQLLASIVLAPDSANVRVGDSVQVTVSLVGKGGGTISGAPLTLTVGNPLLISASPSGWVKGLRVGKTEVLATSEGKRGSAVINVIP